ncbi:MAG TPA: tetratricopeptide repeat protein [Lentimicrobium sp.]|nr:tetratricopeptide repeat protein [Lentimicrobium sp.]
MTRISLILILIPFLAFSQSGLNKETSPGLEKIDAYLQRSSQLVNKNLDSAMYYAEQANSLIENIASDSARVEVYKNLGDVHVARGNVSLSLSYYLKAKKIIDDKLATEPRNLSFYLLQFDILNKIGTVHFFRKNYKQSLDYFNNALDILEKVAAISKNTDPKLRFKVLNNIAAIHIQEQQYEKALDYFRTALQSGIQGRNDNYESSMYNNMGICYMELHDFSMADHYIRRSMAIREQNNDMRGVAQCLNNLGKNYVYNGNFTDARDNFQKALSLGEKIGNRESMLISLESLSSIYDTLGESKKAYRIFRQYKALSDSLFNIESVNKIAQLEMQYEFDKQQQLFDLELKRRATESEKAELVYIIIGGSLFFLLLTAILLIFLQKSKIHNALLKQDKLELQNKKTLLEKEKLQEDLEFKNRELTTNVMYLLKKNELITGITEKLIVLRADSKSENQKIIQEIINELKSTQDRDVWSEFEAHFTQVHLGFYERLNKLYPDLSSNERKLCAFLRLNMSTKDISAITYQSVNSITVARSRLRKKLNIQGEEVNLINFLINV